jgi:hypothetical protein
MTGVCRGLPQFFQTNARIVFWLGHACFLPNPFKFMSHQLYCHEVYGCVTNNNEFWVGGLEFLTPSFTISLNHSQSYHLHSDWTMSVFSSTVTDLRMNHEWLLMYNWLLSWVESYVTTDSQSASLSWCQAPIWGLRPDSYYCQTVADLLVWGALSDERTGLPFTIAVDPRQCSHSRIWVPWYSRSYFTVSDSRLPFSSPPTTRRATVEVFDHRLHTGFISRLQTALTVLYSLTAF